MTDTPYALFQTGIVGPTGLDSVSDHLGYAGVFQPGRLTFGLIAPLEGYPDAPWPKLEHHVAAARQIDALDFAAIWLRDVPFYDPSFGDTGQVIDAFVYAGWLAAQTKRIAIGTAGIVSPLRDPLIVAKQATSLDRLSGGRFILGLATGDRPSKFAAFGNDIGRAGQDLNWIGDNTDGWIWHLSDPHRLAVVLQEWRAESSAFRPYGYGTMFDLLADPHAPLEINRSGMRGGRLALIEHWQRQRDEGVNHVALNMKPLRRPNAEAIDEIAEHILPVFAG